MKNVKNKNVIRFKGKSILSSLLVPVITLGISAFPVSAVEKTSGYIQKVPGRVELNLLGRYDVNTESPRGGLEIVAYNPMNKTAYAIDGINRILIAVPMDSMRSDKFTDLSSKGFKIDLAAAAEAAVKGFSYGDITCVAVSPDNTKLAVTIQAKGYNEPGLVAVFPIDNSEDTLGNPTYIKVGVQPDMLTFSDNNTILTADEGEPRMGYGINSANETVIDPKGSISIVDIKNNTAKTVYFDSFDSQRDALLASGVLITKGQAPSTDFEPEYIAVNSKGSKAYVSLQENNAIAVLDIASASIESVLPLGFKDYKAEANKIYLDGSAKNYENLLGSYMPDGISIYENGGKTYILTANEGDGREWSSTVFPEGHKDAGDPNSDDTSYYKNEKKVTIAEGTPNQVKKVVIIDNSVVEGLPQGKNVLFGGRSFSMFEVADNSLNLVYDSKSDFEKITAELYPKWFNTSHDGMDLNNRSLKKGPEPENITIGKVGNNTYAFVALERIGGIMAYDITNPTNVEYSNYINTRDFAAENGIGGDSGPEGLYFVSAANSITGQALLISGCEITGTMPVYQLVQAPGDLKGKLVILHTNDTHGGDVAVKNSSIGTAGVAELVKDYEAAGADVLLISAGDAIQGDPLVNLSKGSVSIEFMNLAKYDLLVPGNHEFDYGYENLLKLQSIAGFPFVSSNILDKTTNEPVFKDNIIFETEIGKVGVFGLTTPETLTKANPNNVASLSFPSGEEMYKIAQEQVNELLAAGSKYIICVAHLGVDEGSKPNTSLDIIKNVTGIDLLIDGHSHSVIDGNEDDETIVASAGTKFSNVGAVIIDKNNNTESNLISAKHYNKVDTTVNEKVNAKSAEIDAQLSEKFAVNEVTLNGNRAPGVRTQETNLGDFVADALLWAANKAVGEGNVVASITNGGGIRASINKGDITMKTMKTVFPFGNTISTVKVTGAQLLELLEAATFSTPDSLGAFPQVSGIEFTVNTGVPYAKGAQYPNSTYFAPANPGARITNVKVGGEALDLSKTYTIATNDFLASGGDTYYILKNCESFNTYVALEDALVNYTAEVLGGVVTEAKYGKPAGRITINNTSVEEPVSEENTAATYTVVSGDCLGLIAEKHLGDWKRYREIYELNKDIISNPELIYVGQVLRLPNK